MKVGSLFAGIGGFDLGLERAGFEIAWQVEIDPYCQAVLAKHWPRVKRYGDIRELVKGLQSGEIEVCEESALSAKSDQRQAGDPTASHAIPNGWRSGEELTSSTIEPHNGNGARRRKKKSSNDTAVSAFVAENQESNSSPSTIKTETGMQRDGHIIPKLGNSLEGVDSQATIRCSATTATTPNTTMEPVRIRRVDVITAGVPCQPASLAGERRGSDDPRWLWPETLEVIRFIQPAWVILENVVGFLTLEHGTAFESVCASLEAFGYEVQTISVPACAFNAPHIRQRIWILAHHYGFGRRARRKDAQQECESNGSHKPQYVANTDTERRYGRAGMQWEGWRGESEDGSRWPTESGILRVAHGIPHRVDRIRGLGNAIVPQIAEWLGRMIQGVARSI